MSEPKKMFAPNNHSDSVIVWRGVSPEIEKIVPQILKTHYGISEIGEIVQVGALEVQSNNFRVAYVHQGKKMQILVRKHIQRGTLGDIDFANHLIHFLSEEGVLVPQVISSKDGASFVEIEGVFWQVFSFIPGNYYAGSSSELSQAAAGIARLHKALSKLSNVKQPSAPAWVIPTAAEFEPIFNAAKNDKRPIGTLIRDYQDQIEVFINAFSAHQDSIEKIALQFIHSDLHPHNFLFDQGKLAAILDVADIRKGFRAADAASGCHRLVRQFIVASGKPWQEVLTEGLRTYIEAYHTRFPLSTIELNLFPEFMSLALLRKIKGNIKKLYDKKPEWTEAVAHNEFLKQMSLLEEVVVMNEPVRAVIGNIK